MSGGRNTPTVDVAFWDQVIEDSRRTLLCAPGRSAEVIALLDTKGLASMFDVHESPAVLDREILMLDHNAVVASHAEAEQAWPRQTIMAEDANPASAVDSEGGHGTG